MSLSRLNHLLQSNILPFNFGFRYEDWLHLYNTTTLRELCPTDPTTWSEEIREEVDKIAKEEQDLYERMMLLSDDEFYNEVGRLTDG